MHPAELSNLAALWTFENHSLTSQGARPITLHPHGSQPEFIYEGPFGHSLNFEPNGHLAAGYLSVSQQEAPAIAIGGPDAQVSVLAWIKRRRSDYRGCQFLAGIWNEHGRRQYGLFLNLHIWDANEQACAHISSRGSATPGYPYCMDAAIGGTKVTFDEWHTVTMTYDGEFARIYLDGRLDPRGENGAPGANPFHYPGGLLAGTADFTVGAVPRPAAVCEDGRGGFVEEGELIANPFVGLLGGLAIYNRALRDQEVLELTELPVPRKPL